MTIYVLQQVGYVNSFSFKAFEDKNEALRILGDLKNWISSINLEGKLFSVEDNQIIIYSERSRKRKESVSKIINIPKELQEYVNYQSFCDSKYKVIVLNLKKREISWKPIWKNLTNLLKKKISTLLN